MTFDSDFGQYKQTGEEDVITRFRKLLIKPDSFVFGLPSVQHQERLCEFIQSEIRMAKEEGAGEFFELIDKEFESFNIDETMGRVLQKYRDSLK